ncbi:DUF4893 domain-containing protein [Stakelama sp. CBK3Z-3]|uniref:DUF4893 domain-containing protein n=1 Tax=Stakelama flava TaxID=2860338 RepID=A0ABS6XLH4_9SPHN|nr:DUF4893 domain-containing protein [Stakelama flava]MBW4330996.1 DUF4893 domain-containing protein [Stakelama flava]
MALPKSATVLVAIVSLGGCAHRTAARDGGNVDTAQTAPLDWRKVATDRDRERLRGWRDAWMAALPAARAAAPEAIAAHPALFDPDRALATPLPPPGDYSCRTYKLGAARSGLRDFLAYPAYPCTVAREDNVLSLTRYGGSQRPVGLIFSDTATRGVFLGTLVLGNERSPLDYGRDRYRDMAGLVERIDDARWRLVLPSPAFESKLDIVEITPVG